MADGTIGFWDNYAEAYMDRNKKFTIQCARVLHDHMELESAQSILEIACASGIGTRDLHTRVSSSTSILATDYSTKMMELANTNLKDLLSPQLRLQNMNALDLQVEDGQMDRYVASLCLQLIPDPAKMLQEAYRVLGAGGIAGFTIWARPEESGLFPDEHPNFQLGQDLTKLKEQIQQAGFDQVRIWPFFIVASLWTVINHEELQSKQQQLLHQGKPIGLETYIVIAKKK